MPRKKAAKKYVKITSKKTSLNNARKRALKGAVRKVMDLTDEKKWDEARKAFPEAQKAIDKAAKNGVIKKNTASRKKSRLAKKIKEAK